MSVGLARACPSPPLATLGARSSFAIPTGPRGQGYGGQLAPTAQDGPIVFVRFRVHWAMCLGTPWPAFRFQRQTGRRRRCCVKAEDDPKPTSHSHSLRNSAASSLPLMICSAMKVAPFQSLRCFFGHDVGSGVIYQDDNIKVMAVKNTHFKLHQAGPAVGNHQLQNLLLSLRYARSRGGFTGDTGPSDLVMPSTTASIPKVTESSFWCHCIVVLSYGFVLNYIFAQPLEPPIH
jgi:hypothetical protein